MIKCQKCGYERQPIDDKYGIVPQGECPRCHILYDRIMGYTPKPDVIDYKILGDDMQLVEIELDPGEGVRAEVGAMMYMEDGIEMQTSTGGAWKGFKRMISGDNFFISTFRNSGRGKCRAAFGAPYPGKVIPIELDKLGGSIVCQRDSFLCAVRGIEIEVAFTKRIGAGLFGDEGFILQRLTGMGLAFVHAGGTVIEKNLQPGEKLRVDTGCVVAFSASVDYNIQFVGGFKNALFGGEGLFLTRLTGPGVVYLQSLPLSRMADRIMAASKYRGVDTKHDIADVGGALLDGLLKEDKE